MHPSLPFWTLEQPPTREQRQQVLQFLQQEITQTGEAELARLHEWVRPGDLALDIGSNIGTYALALSQLGAEVAAFEANPELARMLTWMALPGVAVHAVALGDHDGTGALSLEPARPDMATLASAAADEGASIVRVPVRRLDAMPLRPPAFIKIDVEGYEEQVLAGAAATLAAHRPVLLVEIEERHNPGGLDRIRRRLEALGYRGSFLKGEAWQAIDLFDAARDQDPRKLECEGPWRRRPLDYVNNFLFVASHKIAIT